jgi:uracil-DNA glycosylase
MDILFNNISDKWRPFFEKDMENISLFLSKLNNYTPSPELWFEWARKTDLDNIKIIIIDQDPYPTKGTAHGLAFSSLNIFPDPLKNIYKCLEQNKIISNYKNTTTCLNSWAEQGVLLLNTALSTEIGKRRAHFDLWQPIITKILVRILKYHINNNLIIMCWGKDAQKLVRNIITSKDKFHILEWCHPSPLNGNKFLSCNHFQLANELLVINGKEPINWASIENNNIPIQIIFTDGSAKSGMGGNKKDKNCKGGYSAVFVSGEIQGELLGCLDTSIIYASNIRAEGQAIISALKKCHEEIDIPHNIQLYTDSEFWIKMLLQYMPKWTDSKFSKKENEDMTRTLWQLWKYINIKHKVFLFHVYSHQSKDEFKIKYNNYADKLADEARKTLSSGKEIFRPSKTM